jgi:signal transduction histidine kinase
VAAFDLHEGIESTLRIAQRQIGRRSVRREFGNVPRVECAPSQINQVLLNLIGNAAHATPEDRGVITIRTQMRGEDHVAIEVADNGHGIPAEVLPKIFDPFFTTKEVGKGTGLGLSISYKIVEGHGGRLEVDSRPDLGTRFTIVLPVKAPAADPGVAAD